MATNNNTLSAQINAIVGLEYSERLDLVKSAGAKSAGGEIAAAILKQALTGADYTEWTSLREGWLMAWGRARQDAGLPPATDAHARKAWSNAVKDTGLEQPKPKSESAAATAKRQARNDVPTVAAEAAAVIEKAKKAGVSPVAQIDDAVRKARESAVSREDIRRVDRLMAVKERVEKQVATATKVDAAIAALPTQLRKMADLAEAGKLPQHILDVLLKAALKASELAAEEAAKLRAVEAERARREAENAAALANKAASAASAAVPTATKKRGKRAA